MTEEPILSVEGVGKRFGGVAAVNEASFDVAPGSITGLIGPNGAGKTTMFNLISGFLHPDRGTIHFDGWRCDGRRPHALAATGLVRTFQIPRVLTRMTVLENMMLAGMHQPGERLGRRSSDQALARREREIRERRGSCSRSSASAALPATTPARSPAVSASSWSLAAP